MVNIRQDLVPNQNAIVASGTNKRTYVAVHETANRGRGANAASHARLQKNGNDRQASWHYQVDDIEAVQSYLDTTRCWHAGRSEYALDAISIEICVNSDGDYDKALQNAAELVAHLRDKHDIPWNRVISHKFITGKACPAIMLADGRWDDFVEATDPSGAKAVTAGGSESSAPKSYTQRDTVEPDVAIMDGKGTDAEQIGTAHAEGYTLNVVSVDGSWTEVRWNVGTGDSPEYVNAWVASASLEQPAGWPHEDLPKTDKHTSDSHNAWVELMAAVGYTDDDLGKNLQSWLNNLTDPRTGRGYYDLSVYNHDGIMGPVGVKGLQRKLYDTSALGKQHLYYGVADGHRGPLTVHAEIDYLNWQRQFLI